MRLTEAALALRQQTDVLNPRYAHFDEDTERDGSEDEGGWSDWDEDDEGPRHSEELEDWGDWEADTQRDDGDDGGLVEWDNFGEDFSHV